jgi:transcriptional regulator NrdR family protein
VSNRANKPKPIKCPHCGGKTSKVVTTREQPDWVRAQLAWRSGLWRRRRCLDCLKVFNTREAVVIFVTQPDKTTISSSRAS